MGRMAAVEGHSERKRGSISFAVDLAVDLAVDSCV